MKGHREVVFAVRFSRDGNWLASGSWDATFRLWNVHTDEFRVVDLGDVSLVPIPLHSRPEIYMSLPVI